MNNMKITTSDFNKNSLKKSKSPYLKQHSDNPVHWNEWSNEIFDFAIKHNKLVVISIGYAACHWCHVMEKESFRDVKVAELMNKHFISIKVDREERPDIDNNYMSAVHLMQQRGGWPLNCILLPDGRPFFGGTYFRKDDWMNILEKIQLLWEKDPQRIIDSANEISKGIANLDMVSLKPVEEINETDSKEFYDKFIKMMDRAEGGSKGAPKFPMPDSLLFLLDHASIYNDKEGLDILDLTMTKMQQGGIYDHLRGGFARYSVDANWRVPHFEKMLYDNALLLELYSKAFRKTGNQSYRNTAYGIFEFLKNEMISPEGAFFSAIDADSEGKEGLFYTWTTDEITKILDKETSDIFRQSFNMKNDGNFEEGRNILYKLESDEKLAETFGMDIDNYRKLINDAKQSLLLVRNKRIRPLTDDKILTSWNALMINALIEMARSFGDDEVFETAKTALDFIIENQIDKDNTLYHASDGKTARIPGMLDDYTYLIMALLGAYEYGFDEDYITIANTLTKEVEKRFGNDISPMFFFSQGEASQLSTRGFDLRDDVIPSSNSVMAGNLIKLSLVLDNQDYYNKAFEMVKAIQSEAIQSPLFHGRWARLIHYFTGKHFDISIIGRDPHQTRKQIDWHFIPGAFFTGCSGKSELAVFEGKENYEKHDNIYLCKGTQCFAPVNSVEEMLVRIGREKG